jgi:hypothetical protein
MHEPSTREYLKATISASFVLHGYVLSYYAYRRQERIMALLYVLSIQIAPQLLLLCALYFILHGNIQFSLRGDLQNI